MTERPSDEERIGKISLISQFHNFILSRKKFTDGIGYLFSDDDAGILSEESVLLSATSVGDKKRTPGGRSSGGKGFAADLESFLKEAFEESFEAHTNGSILNDEAHAAKKRLARRPDSGLDLLIRSTVEPVIVTDADTNTRRVTLLFDPKKLEKLKTIAKLERTYLKDIMDELVQEFIQNYEQRKGSLQ